MYPNLLFGTDMTSWHLLAAVESSGHLNVILLFGLVILGGTFGARLFQKLHIPQVVGCIVVGVLLRNVLHVIGPQTIEHLEPFAMFALGLIGFMIGAELRGDIFRKYGRQFFIILFSEGAGAFILVSAGAGAVAWLMTRNMPLSIAMGLLLGAVSSATAPAATVNVLWEYKAKGPLTATILAIVALDDALALLLYRGAATGARAILGTTHSSVLIATAILFGEIVGAVLLGILAGVLLLALLKITRADDKVLAFSISCLLLVVGISMVPGIDPILPAMTLGITIANLLPRRSKGVFGLVERFSLPIYVSFFVLAGAHIEFGKLSFWVILLTVTYILCRVIGKVAGAALGAKYSGAPQVVRKYLGICLQSQAGVAIGLAVLAGQQFGPGIGHTIIMVVMTATFVVEILGPILVKAGVKRAGEVGLNITEEDLVATYSVADVMDTDAPIIPAGISLGEIIKIVGDTNDFYYPVIDTDNKLIGGITLDGIRNTFATQELNDWLVALDIAEPVVDTVTPEIALSEAFESVRRLDVEHLPVTTSGKERHFAGVLDCRAVRRRIAAEVLARQQKADSMHSGQGV